MKRIDLNTDKTIKLNFKLRRIQMEPENQGEHLKFSPYNSEDFRGPSANENVCGIYTTKSDSVPDT